MAIDHLLTLKRMDELEAKNSFLLGKANKLKDKLQEEKKEHQEAIGKLNSALLFNQKLEEYIGNPSDVINKARLFDENLVKHPVSATKVIPALVDFAEKMEELLTKMRSLFDGLQSEAHREVTLENLPDISSEIPSMTRWGWEATPTETSTKPDHPGPSKPIKEMELEEAGRQMGYDSPPQKRKVESIMKRKEIPINDMVENIIGELYGKRDQPSRSETPCQLARIDVIQIGSEELLAKWMRDLSTPSKASIPEPATIARLGP